MKMKNIIATTILSLLTAASSQAGGSTGSAIRLSDFFQDWTLNSAASSGPNSEQCYLTISAIPGDTIPGVMGVPGPGYDSSQNIRFRFNRDQAGETEQVLNLGQSQNSNVALNGNVLSLTEKSKFLFFSRTTLSETFTLQSDGSLIIANNGNGSKSTCVFSNAHPQLVGQMETGLSLSIAGVKVAECTFVPATPRADQVGFVYTEACDFGKYTNKTTITMTGEVVKEELAANPLAPHDLVVVRATDKLNTGTENWLSLDSEIFVQDDDSGIKLPPVDDFQINNSEYFISPYESSQYSIYGTNGVVQIEYSNQ